MAIASLSSLPLELIQEIVAHHQAVDLHVSDPYWDSVEPAPPLHPLLLVSRAFYHAAVPFLWRHIDTSQLSVVSVMRLQEVLQAKLSLLQETGCLPTCCSSSEYFLLKRSHDSCRLS